MKILVIGKSGQVAQALAQRAHAHPRLALEFAGRPGLDLEVAGSALQAIRRARPDLVINAAGYAAVDLAEKEPGRANAVNATGAQEVASAAAEVGAAILHVSTDYVFDGTSERPYREDDRPAPLGAYGRSKLAGEAAVRVVNPRHLIVRTSWVISPFGRNFVRHMVDAAANGAGVRVVADQIGSPTSALDLADALLGAAAGDGPWGTYHLAGTGEASWAEVAEAVMDRLRDLGAPTSAIDRITSADWPAAARRPANSRLDSAKFRESFGITMPDWRNSLGPIVERLAAP